MVIEGKTLDQFNEQVESRAIGIAKHLDSLVKELHLSVVHADTTLKVKCKENVYVVDKVTTAISAAQYLGFTIGCLYSIKRGAMLSVANFCEYHRIDESRGQELYDIVLNNIKAFRKAVGNRVINGIPVVRIAESISSMAVAVIFSEEITERLKAK